MLAPCYPERSSQPQRLRRVAPEDALQLVEDEDEAIGQQHLVEMIARVEEADREPLDRDAVGLQVVHGLVLARQNDVYLKLVVLEKNEFIFNRIDFSGQPVRDDPRCAGRSCA